MELHNPESVDLASLVSQIADGIYFTDMSGTFRYANEAMAQILGLFSPREVIGRHFLEFVIPERRGELEKLYVNSLAAGEESESIETKIVRPDGSHRWIDIRPTRAREGSDLHGSFGTIRDITGQKEQEETLRTLVFADDLTGLLNRRGMKSWMTKTLSWAREMGQAVSVLFIDIDGFKHINDTYGHGEGDRALLIIADSMRGSFRKQDIIGRWGGDEFIVAAIDVPGGSVERLALRFQANLAERCTTESLPYPLTTTIGSANSESSRSYSISRLLADADTDLYKRKKARSDQ